MKDKSVSANDFNILNGKNWIDIDSNVKQAPSTDVQNN